MAKPTKAEKLQFAEAQLKVHTLLQALDEWTRRRQFDRLILQPNGEVHLASWTVDHHNGDIDDYEERVPKKAAELLSWVPHLEKAYKEQAWGAFKRNIQDAALQQLYINAAKGTAQH